MPNRVLYESVLTSDSLAAVSWEAAYLFIVMMTYCDDFGLFIAEPDVVMGQCLPKRMIKYNLRPKDVAEMLDELVAQNMFILYRNGTRTYGKYTNWRPKPRANRPKYPTPEDPASEILQTNDRTSANICLPRGGSNNKRITYNDNDNERKCSQMSADAFDAADYMRQCIVRAKPTHRLADAAYYRGRRTAWADTMRLLHEKDGRPYALIRQVAAWCAADDFEAANVQSPDKLRKRFDALETKMRKAKRGASVGVVADEIIKLADPNE